MKEVRVFLAPKLYKANPDFVRGLQANNIAVSRRPAFGRSGSIIRNSTVFTPGASLRSSNGGSFKIESSPAMTRKKSASSGASAVKNGATLDHVLFEYYSDAVAEHRDHFRNDPSGASDGQPGTTSLRCLAFEDSLTAVHAARKAGLTVIGISSSPSKLKKLGGGDHSAHATGFSISELLQAFGIVGNHHYYQVQYLPYAIQFRLIEERKVGYPVSLLDQVKGRFVPKDDNSTGSKENHDSSDTEEASSDESSAESPSTEGGGCVFVLDSKATRVIPRQVLGIAPGSLADTYINNIGWSQDDIPTFQCNSRELERDIIRMFAKLYRVSPDVLRGFVTSGGTEGNFTGLWWQRDYLKRKSAGHRPILITSEQTHYSVTKAAQQLNIDVQKVPARRSGEMDCAALARILEQLGNDQTFRLRPILMNVNLGTTQTGALDDLPIIHQILVDKVRSRGVAFSVHVDAALMGAVVPVINPFGEHADYFADYDVKTIAISGHKFFGSVCICGLCLTTARFLEECFGKVATGNTADGAQTDEGNAVANEARDINVDYVSGLHDITPSGSRSGFNVLSFHNTLCGLSMHTDASHLRQIVNQCYHNVEYFLKRIQELFASDPKRQAQILHAADSLSVCFPRPSSALMTKYSLMPVSLPGDEAEYAGICILANVGPHQIDAFLADYASDILC